MPITRSPCCATSLENRFPAWLSAVGGREHLWMRDNLEVSLTANLGTSSMLDTDHLAVRVARIDAFSRLFTWAQKLDHTCPSYGEEVALVILSSNAMHYLLRLLQTAIALFETELEQSGRTAVRIRPNAGDELISQVHTAMQMYRARTELSADGLADLEQLFAAAPYPVTRATETMYQATVTWLLLHEVGHAIGDMAGLAPPARWFLDALPFALDEERYKRWADELSADFNASRRPPVAYVSRT